MFLKEGNYNSGQPKAGPTQPTLTTVPSIRNEIQNKKLEVLAIDGMHAGQTAPVWGGREAEEPE